MNVWRESNVELHGDRLCKLKLTSLVDRRLRGDLIETYKIVTGKEKVRNEDFLVFSDTGCDL